MKSLSVVQLFVTPWTVDDQAPPSMGVSRQEYWSGLPFPSSGDLPDPGIKPGPPTLQADSLPYEPQGKLRLMSTSISPLLCSLHSPSLPPSLSHAKVCVHTHIHTFL